MEQYRSEVEGDPTSCLAMNACFKADPLEMCMCRCRVMATNHVFTHKVRQPQGVKRMVPVVEQCVIFQTNFFYICNTKQRITSLVLHNSGHSKGVTFFLEYLP